MTKKNIIFLLLSFLLSSLVTGVVYIVLLRETFDLFGIESIVDPESGDAKIFYTALILTVFSLTIITVFILKQKKFVAIGIGIPLLLSFWVLIKIGPTYISKSSYYEIYDSIIWNQAEEKPIKMARYLVKNNQLIGLTTEQINFKFRIDMQSNVDERISFILDYSHSYLSLKIENNTVVNASIWVAD